MLTTATDVNGLFAVDVFAKKNNCHIFRMKEAKEVSAALLAGEKVGFYSEFPWEGELPEGLIWCQKLAYHFLKYSMKLWMAHHFQRWGLP